MGIENGDKISDLNPLWPLGTDPVSQGDDQIRLIKNVMVNDALGKSEGGTISADLTVDGVLTADSVTADSITADSITADNVTVNNNLTALSGGLGGTFEPVLTAKQTRSSKSLEQNIITSATDAIGVWSGFQFEVSKGDATAGTDLIASINRNGLQVDSISSMGGGHVDGAGKVVQFKQAVNTTATTIADATTATIITLNFTPKFSDSLILVQGFHSEDRCSDAKLNYLTSFIYAGPNEVARANAVGFLITKEADARFQYSYSGSIDSWGTTPLAIDLRGAASYGDWSVSYSGHKTSLYVWEIAQ